MIVFFNPVGITRAWRSTSPSCQREHRHKTNVKMRLAALRNRGEPLSVFLAAAPC